MKRSLAAVAAGSVALVAGAERADARPAAGVTAADPALRAAPRILPFHPELVPRRRYSIVPVRPERGTDFRIRVVRPPRGVDFKIVTVRPR